MLHDTFFRKYQKVNLDRKEFSKNHFVFAFYRNCFWNSQDLKNVDIKEMASSLDMVNTLQTFGGHMQIR